MIKTTRRIIYIPGIGRKYDWLRSIGLWTWRFRLGVKTQLVAMNWEDGRDTAEQKYARVQAALLSVPGETCIVVAESAGGAVGIGLANELSGNIERLITVCGKNRGAASITPSYRRRFPELVKAVEHAENTFATLSKAEKRQILCLYSTGDKLLGSHDTTLPGCRKEAVGNKSHGLTIWGLLFLLNSETFKSVLTEKSQH